MQCNATQCIVCMYVCTYVYIYIVIHIPPCIRKHIFIYSTFLLFLASNFPPSFSWGPGSRPPHRHPPVGSSGDAALAALRWRRSCPISASSCRCPGTCQVARDLPFRIRIVILMWIIVTIITMIITITYNNDYDYISCIIGIQWDMMGIYMRCCHSHAQSPAKMKVYSWAKHRTKWR